MADKYQVPEETAEIFLEYVSCTNCMDACVKSVFRASRAIKYGKLAEKSRLKFWRQVKQIYPELENKELTYSAEKREVSIVR